MCTTTKKVIAKFNAVSEDLTINLPLNKIKKEDKIVIRHGDDTPCHSCKFILLVRDERKRKLGIAETKEFWGKLSISLSDLVEIVKKNQSKRLDFYYFEKEANGEASSEKLVLQVVLK